MWRRPLSSLGLQSCMHEIQGMHDIQGVHAIQGMYLLGPGAHNWHRMNGHCMHRTVCNARLRVQQLTCKEEIADGLFSRLEQSHDPDICVGGKCRCVCVAQPGGAWTPGGGA